MFLLVQSTLTKIAVLVAVPVHGSLWGENVNANGEESSSCSGLVWVWFGLQTQGWGTRRTEIVGNGVNSDIVRGGAGEWRGEECSKWLPGPN